MIKQLAALALAGSVILGSASSAVAEVKHQPMNVEGTDRILKTVQAVGYNVFSGGGPCDTAPAYGVVAPDMKAFLICVDNHGNRTDLLADTVRHEAVHVAQYCKAKRVGATNALLMPEQNDTFTALALHDLNAPFHMYPPSHRPFEAEAFAVAHVADDDMIVKILKEECGL